MSIVLYQLNVQKHMRMLVLLSGFLPQKQHFELNPIFKKQRNLSELYFCTENMFIIYMYIYNTNTID